MAHRMGRVGRPTFQVSGGFYILLAILFLLDQGVGVLLPALAAAAVHELGHLIAMFAANISVRRISLTASGAEIEMNGQRIAYWQDGVVAAAGPLASFLCAWLGFHLKLWVFAAVCAGQGIFNLMPVDLLDGGRILHAVLAGLLGDECSERVMMIVSALIAGGLLGGGMILFRKYGNPTLLVTAGWLFAATFRRKR